MENDRTAYLIEMLMSHAHSYAFQLMYDWISMIPLQPLSLMESKKVKWYSLAVSSKALVAVCVHQFHWYNHMLPAAATVGERGWMNYKVERTWQRMTVGERFLCERTHRSWDSMSAGHAPESAWWEYIATHQRRSIVTNARNDTFKSSLRRDKTIQCYNCMWGLMRSE